MAVSWESFNVISRRFYVALMKYALLVLVAFTVQSCERRPLSRVAQPMKSELWWSYLADYDGLPGSTLVNLALKPHAPIHDRSILLVTGVSYQSSPKNSGLPDAAEFDLLNRLSTKRLTLITEHSMAIFVGSFTHKNEQLDYIYLADPDGLEAALREFYQTECPARRPYINLRSDPQWQAYLDFLYPNAQTIQHYREEFLKLGAL
jgi:hypothetical protein